MDESLRALVALSAVLAAGGRERLEVAMREAERTTAAGAVEEALLQSHLFLGYPAALNGFGLWREVSGLPAPAPLADDRATWPERGAEVCAKVYGGQYARLRENVAGLHPEMERWMLEEGYGKVLGRPGLSLATRELCIAAMLVALDARPQLYAHLRGALNVGAGPEVVEEALTLACEVVPEHRATAARAVWAEVRRRWEGQGASG